MGERLKRMQTKYGTFNNQEKAFYTDIVSKEPVTNDLTKYVDNLDNKIDYAKWKQNLVLKFNYMPIKRITQKVQTQKENYLKKIQEEEIKCAKILSGKQITVQLDLFRDFSKRLDEKMKDMEDKIAKQLIKKEMLTKVAEEKRMRLKQIMKQNMQILKQKMQMSGINNKQDIITLIRSKSTKDRFISQGVTLKSQLKKEQNINYSIYSTLSSPKFYEECLSKLAATIQSMKSTEDIQSGIYLDIMDKAQKKYSSDAKYSLKSKICDTLYSRYAGKGRTDRQKNSHQKTDFQIDWETFKQLNWKQIMGIILVRDRNCQKTKNLLRFH